jgi:hypothetical protein
MGFTYGRRLPQVDNVSEESIIQTIRNREWDYVIYSKIGRDEGGIGSLPTAPLWSIVSENYTSDRIAFLYGEDSPKMLSGGFDPWSQHLQYHLRHGTCFVRELV